MLLSLPGFLPAHGSMFEVLHQDKRRSLAMEPGLQELDMFLQNARIVPLHLH